MDSRFRPHSSRHGEAEPDIISPEAARLSGGGRSGRERSSHRSAAGGAGHSGREKSGHRSALGGADPRSHRSSHPREAHRGNGLGTMYEDEEMHARRNYRGHSGRPPHHGREARAPSAGPNFHQGRRHDYAGGEDSAQRRRHDNARREDSAQGRRHDNARREDSAQGRRHDNARREDDLEDRLGSLHLNQPRSGRQGLHRVDDRFEDHGARPYHHTNTGRPSHSAGENQYSEAAGTSSGRHHSANHHHKNNDRGHEVFQDNERYGGSRRGDANRVRDRSEGAYREPDAGPSRATVGRRDTHSHSEPQEEEGRFIPYTFRMLDPNHVKVLENVFRVRTSKVKEWCEADYIRMDTKKDRQTNIDPLLKTLSSKDRERYAALLRRNDNERRIGELTGWGPRHVPSAYERGFYEGEASARRECEREWRSAGYR